ncbi:MAG: SEL1-like repeat protein [Planctomycetota bacterium]|nr:SEL1-like repeat protein [Planctomycetota bacterium]
MGIPKDITKAIFWYGKAAEQGSETARKNLSELTQ